MVNKAVVIEKYGDYGTDPTSGLNRARENTPCVRSYVEAAECAADLAKRLITGLRDVLCSVVDHPVPSPGKGEVLVRINLRPINPADVWSLCSLYRGFNPKSLPAVPVFARPRRFVHLFVSKCKARSNENSDLCCTLCLKNLFDYDLKETNDEVGG